MDQFVVRLSTLEPQIWLLTALIALGLVILLVLLTRTSATTRASQQAIDAVEQLSRNLDGLGSRLDERVRQLEEHTRSELRLGREDQHKSHVEVLKSLGEGVRGLGDQVNKTLNQNTEQLGKRVEHLTTATDNRLKEISGQVEKRLAEGFEKTNKTFNDVVERLAKIDEAQKKITELSGNVVSLQEILSDKRSRGAFGEIQLADLVSNVMPESSYSLQHSFDTGARADCVLFLPDPTGNICIDAKFPLENYRRLTDHELGDADRAAASKAFVQDVKKHIKDISGKYIIPGQTSDGAVMFIPAESVFAEIHGRYYELVEEAQRAKVWIASPTTLVAILTTARSVLKDEATRKQVHIIQEHLMNLNKDFGRFQERMDKLALHIDQANRDVQQVNTSARKISSRFKKIEKVELDDEGAATALNQTAVIEDQS